MAGKRPGEKRRDRERRAERARRRVTDGLRTERPAVVVAERNMKLKVVIHDAEEGGFWAEVPSIPGCATQGDSIGELLINLHEAIEGCLSVGVRL